MLTNEDLHAIGTIFDEKFEKGIRPLRKDIKRIQKTLDLTIKTFDDDLDKVKRRVDRVEDHLQLPPIN
jgi:hypothetical protein